MAESRAEQSALIQALDVPRERTPAGWATRAEGLAEAAGQGTHDRILFDQQRSAARADARPTDERIGGLGVAPTGSRPAARILPSRGPATSRVIDSSTGNSTLTVETPHNPLKIFRNS
jgi:hypothetical protein